MKEKSFDDINNPRQTLHLTAEEIESTPISNKTKEPIDKEILLEKEQSTFEDLRGSFKAIRKEEAHINFILQKTSFNSETYEILHQECMNLGLLLTF